MSNPEDLNNPAQEGQDTATVEPTETADGTSEESPRLAMDVEISETGPCRKHLKVVIPPAEIDRQFKSSLQDLRKDALVPGFRPGRAPANLVQRRFKKEVAGQVKSSLLTAALQQVEEEHKLHAISQPKLDIDAIELVEGSPLTIEMDLEVQPEFALPEYKGLTVRRPVWEITEKQVDDNYQRWLDRYAQEVPKEEGATAELGDYVTADLQFEKDGVLLNTDRDRKFQILPELRFRDGVIPDLGTALVGARIGDVREATARINPSAPDAAIRGTTIRVVIRIHDLKTKRPVEVTTGFLNLLGFDSVEEVRQEIRKMLERRRDYEQSQMVRRSLLDQLIERTPFELPADLVARQERSTLRGMVQQMKQAGLSDADIRASELQLRSNAHEATLRNLKELFLLARISEAEEITIEPEDLEEELVRISERTGESLRRVRARIEKENLSESLATQILERKTIDRLLGYSKIEDYPLEREDKPVETLEDTSASSIPEPDEPEGDEAGEDAADESQGTDRATSAS